MRLFCNSETQSTNIVFVLMMTVTEKVELCIIAILLVLAALLFNAPTVGVKFSMVIVYCASLLFGQSLLRDLWYLYAKRNRSLTKAKPVIRQCMCVESTVGVLGLVLGILLLSSTFDIEVMLSKIVLLSLMCLILLGGFLIKDYVVEWNPWRLYKEKDHMNIIFSWKKT